MKKIFTILCAIAIAFSASAVSLQHLNLAKKHNADARIVSMRPEIKKAKADLPKEGRKLMASAPRRMMADTYTVNCTEASCKFYAEDNDCYVVLQNDMYEFSFDIRVPAGQTDLTNGQTYTLDDMIIDYTYGADYAAQSYIDYASCNLVRTVEDGMTRYNATVVDLDGNTYNVVYQETPCEAADTITVGAVNDVDLVDFTASSAAFQFSGATNEYEIYVAAQSNTVAGTYTSEDLLLDNTFMYDLQNDNASIKICGGDVVVEAVGNDYTVTATLIGKNGHAYAFTMTYTMPVAENYKTITATDLVVDASYFDLYMMFMGYGIFDAFAANDTVKLSFTSYDAIAGTYDATGVAGTIEGSDIFSANLVVAEAGASYTITGTALCKNNTEYTLNLSYVLPEATRQATLNMTGELQDFTGEIGAWQAIAEDESALLSITINATTIAGNYTMADNYGDGYTYVMEINGTDTLYQIAKDLNLTVIVQGEQAIITGTMLCQNYDDPTDVPEYTITMTCDIVAPSSCMEYDATEEDGAYTESFGMADVTFDDEYLADYGVVYLDAENEDGAILMIEFYDANFNGQLTQGVYTITDTQEDMTVTPSVGVQGSSVYPSFAGYIDGEGYIVAPLWFMESGTVTVNADGITINAYNSCEQAINVQIGRGAGLKNINGEAEKATKAIRNGQLVIRVNGTEYNAQGAEL